MRFDNRRKQFRSILNGDRCVYPGSVFDPISARIAEDIGFEVGMFAGSIASFTVLGAPDVIVLTLSEFAQQAQRINRSSELPLMVDADHGYGNALNVKRTVEELEMAGVSGMSIEDTELPQPFGSVGRTKLLSIPEGVGKMKAALDGRQDPNLIIAGRTSAPGVTNMEDALERAMAYEKVGVDAIFLVGVKTKEQLEKISDAISIPIILGGGGSSDMMNLDYLSAKNVRICLQGHQPFSAAVKAIYDTMKALREGTPPDELQGIASAELMEKVTNKKDYENMFDKYLK